MAGQFASDMNHTNLAMRQLTNRLTGVIVKNQISNQSKEKIVVAAAVAINRVVASKIVMIQIIMTTMKMVETGEWVSVKLIVHHLQNVVVTTLAIEIVV